MKRIKYIIPLGLLVYAASVQAAPVTFNTALPVSEGETVIRMQGLHNKSGADPSGAQREMTVKGFNTMLAYGVDGDFTVFGVFPFADKELETAAGTRDASGLGDVRLFGRYMLFQSDTKTGTLRLAPFLGIETPTGQDDKRDGAGLLPASVQLGSGSWDPFGGLILTLQKSMDYNFGAQIAWQGNNAGDNFEMGDKLQTDAAFQHKIWDSGEAEGVSDYLYGGVEANWVHQGKARLSGITDPNSGGTTLHLSPTVQYITKRTVFEAAVQIPVMQNLNGTGLENDAIVLFGFRRNF